MLIILIFFLLRLRKRKSSPQALASGTAADAAATGGGGEGGSVGSTDTGTGPGPGPETATAAGATRLFDRWRRSSQSFGSPKPPPASDERGFQKVSGRKIQSVLETGGDGYDDPFGDDKAYPGPGGGRSAALATGAAAAGAAAAGRQTSKTKHPAESTQHIPSPPLGRPGSQESGGSEEVVVRPSPARTPVESSTALHSGAGVSATTGRIPPTSPPTEPLPPVPSLRASRIGGSSGDGVGRSHPSASSSRTSRFTEGI